MLNVIMLCYIWMLDVFLLCWIIGCFTDKLDLIMLIWKQLCYVGSDYAMLNVIILCWIFGRIMILIMLHDFAILNVVSYVGCGYAMLGIGHDYNMSDAIMLCQIFDVITLNCTWLCYDGCDYAMLNIGRVYTMLDFKILWHKTYLQSGKMNYHTTHIVK